MSPGCTLSGPHVAYLEARGVSRETAEAAGAYSAARPSQIPSDFSPWQRRRCPALVASHLSPDLETAGCQTHPDHPGKDKDGDPIKWMSAKGARVVLATHPRTVEAVRRGTERLWMAEGWTRMLALTERGEVAVSYAGASSWRQDKKPLACFDHMNLAGRLVLDVPDADHRTNANVQRELGERVAFLQSRGAVVLVVSVPEVNGDASAGLDDYIAAGGNPEALVRDARPFVPSDVAAERLDRDEELRHGVAALSGRLDELETRKVGECSAWAVARYLAGTSAPEHGKPHPRGLVVRPSRRQIAAGIRVGTATVKRSLERLAAEDVRFLEPHKPAHGKRAASYLLLFDPWGGGSKVADHKEGLRVGGKEGQEGESKREQGETSYYQRESSSSGPQPYGLIHGPEDLKKRETVPPLRNSKVVHTFDWRGGERVMVHSDFYRRYGKKREAIFRYALNRGRVEDEDLLEKFGSKKALMRNFRRVYLRGMETDGVLVRDGAGVAPAPDWPAALEAVRARTDEDADNAKQDERYRDDARRRRERIAGEDAGTVAKPEPTPELLGPERVKEIFAADAERDHAARVEDQRRKVGITAETFIADALEGIAGFGWRELGNLWRDRGGKREDLGRVVRDPATPYRFVREADDLLYVERAESVNAVPKKGEAAEVVPMSPEAAEDLSKLNIAGAPENLSKPDAGDPRDVFRNNPMHASKMHPHASPGMMTNDDTVEAPGRLPPKVNGVYHHGPECACWMCGDEAEAGPVEIGASA